MLSAPVPPPPVSALPQRPPSPAPSTINLYTTPSTPIGEPITTLQNDPMFLLSTPPTPPLPLASMVPPPLPESTSDWQGVTSLSPPPRRGSRRISAQERESLESTRPTPDAAGPDVQPARLSISLSPSTSAVSLLVDM
ncbi:uncharacterized protein FIBRA_05164 [Fibroporia radiculosa]|uniref:Uncharacterized protein n=1 Tax=Fibroporia radiculosa TaxID=599839 RepID=J4IAK0_9APHY|nr:uncharacterized protein FIBRA_05164 [Fibroporia radiculosa]CCM03046.1 predicted protein [Fibroporia radiculosa]